MKELLIEKLKDPKVKNAIIQITANIYNEIWDEYNNIDRGRIYASSYGYNPEQPSHIKTPFFYARRILT